MEQKDIDQAFAGESVISGPEMHKEIKQDIDLIIIEIMDLIKSEEVVEIEGHKFLKITNIPDVAVEKIHTAAVLAKETNVYKRREGKLPERWEKASFNELYTEMLYKILNAPTQLHMMCTPRIMLPAIDEALRREYGIERG